MYSPRADGLSAADLCDAVEQLQAIENLVLSLKLEAILAYERTEAWRADGAQSIEAWVAYALGAHARTAAGYVRVARAFRRLPLLHLAFREGRFSFDQVRALAEVATPDNEAQLVEECACRSAGQIARLVRAMRPVSVEDAEEANADRWVRWWWSNDDRSLDLAARLPAAEGRMVVAALDRVARRWGRDGAPARPTHEQRCADALVELTCAGPSVPAGPDAGASAAGPLIVVHTDSDALCGEEGTAAIEGGPPIASETVRRLACDAQTLVIAERDGMPIGIGRRSRVVPPSLMRVLRQRDKGCRFPGCGRTRWVHAHHRRHWAHGGRTDAGNLVLLCGTHHRFVHEARVRIEGLPDGELHFFDRYGRQLVAGPRGIRPAVRRRLEAIGATLPECLAPAWVEAPPPSLRE